MTITQAWALTARLLAVLDLAQTCLRDSVSSAIAGYAVARATAIKCQASRLTLDFRKVLADAKQDRDDEKIVKGALDKWGRSSSKQDVRLCRKTRNGIWAQALSILLPLIIMSSLSMFKGLELPNEIIVMQHGMVSLRANMTSRRQEDHMYDSDSFLMATYNCSSRCSRMTKRTTSPPPGRSKCRSKDLVVNQ